MKQAQNLQLWCALHCNGDWEHEYGVEISTIDNPGWCLKIDIKDTLLEGFSFEREENKGLGNWYSAKTKDNTFVGFGDLDKLNLLIDLFFVDFFTANISLSNFKYTIYAPLKINEKIKVWRPLIAKMRALNEFIIIERPQFNVKDLKSDDIKILQELNIDQLIDASEFQLNDIVKCRLLFFFDFPSLAIQEKLIHL